jgi:carbamoylphosphate synthase small subunit
MIERLFFDGINAEAGRTTVSRQHHPAVAPGPNEAEAALAVMQLAETGA